jgi:5'-methylthioadenosine phosphorylase
MTIGIAVIGGSGLYGLGAARERRGPVDILDVDGCEVAFLNRHGPGHRLPPHAIDYRANVDVLAALGVETVLATFACGSLEPTLGPGSLVVPDQLVDLTRRRVDTFHDRFDDGPAHTPFADPYDERARRALLDASGARDGATVAVIDGPRFATRAESRWYRAMGCDLVNMTQYPESVLARERGLRYGSIGLVTDFDAGMADRPDVAPVTQEAVFAEFERHLPRLRAAVLAAVGLLSAEAAAPA